MFSWFLDDRPKHFVTAISMLVVANVLDIVSSMVQIPGTCETNILMRDPHTCQFLLVNGVVVKALWLVGSVIPAGVFIQKVFGSWKLASVPAVLAALPLFDTAVGNIVLKFKP